MSVRPSSRLIVVIVLAALLASPLVSSHPGRGNGSPGAPPAGPGTLVTTPISSQGLPARPVTALVHALVPPTSPSAVPVCPIGCLGTGPLLSAGSSASGGVSSWQNLTATAGSPPPHRQGASAAFDAAPGAGYLLLYGGEGATGLDHDTWIYQGGVWRNVTATACGAVCPPRLAYASMAYDPADESVVLVGGLTASCPTSCGELISDVAYFWTNGEWRTSVAAAYYAFGASLAWDADDRCLLTFGGTSSGGPVNLGLGTGESACFNATAGNWSIVSGFANGPSARWGAAMANTSTGIDLLFGGDSLGGPLNDTWEFYNGSWYQVDIGGPAPPARMYAALTESPSASLGVPIPVDSAVLFEGQSSAAALDDTWLFSGGPPRNGHAYGNWSQDTTEPTPPSAWGPAAAVDFTNSSVITFGGTEPGLELATTWAYFHPVVVVDSSESEYRASTTAAFTARAAGGLSPYTYTWTGSSMSCSARMWRSLTARRRGSGSTTSRWGSPTPTVAQRRRR